MFSVRYFSLHASFYILLFPWTWSFSMPFSIMTLPWRHSFFDRSQWKLQSICEIKKKDILFARIFWFSEYLLRKLWLITKITSIVQLPYTFPLSSLGRPLGWVLLGTHLPHTPIPEDALKKINFWPKFWVGPVKISFQLIRQWCLLIIYSDAY